MRIETSPDGVVTVYVEAKVNKRHAYGCPVCGRKCPGYDQGSSSVRRWMTPDMGGLLPRNVSYALIMEYSILQFHGHRKHPLHEGF